MKTNLLYAILGACCLSAAIPERASAEERLPDAPRTPLLTVKTDVLYWLTASFNAGLEVGLAPQMTLDVAGAYNPWTFEDNRKMKFWQAQSEFRYWPGRRFSGHFLGIHLLYTRFNAGDIGFMGLAGLRADGHSFGTGLSYGYQWALGKRWRLEATVGIGYIRSDYDRYEQERCGKFLGRFHKNYVGPTRLGITFCFTIE